MEQLEMRYEGGLMVTPATPEGLIIRNYEPNDFEQTLDALTPLTGKRYDARELDEVILLHEGVAQDQVFVAELCGKIVGTATGWTRGDIGTLHMVSALPEVSGLGVGYALCAAAVNRLLEKGCARVELTTDDFRLSAITVYTKLGFRPVIRNGAALERWERVYSRLGYESAVGEAFK